MPEDASTPFDSDHKLLSALRGAGRISVIFATIVIFLGFLRLIWGIICFFVTIEVFPETKISAGDSHSAIAILVGSLEFFLLAPLLYLQLRALGDFIQSFILSKTGKLKASKTATQSSAGEVQSNVRADRATSTTPQPQVDVAHSHSGAEIGGVLMMKRLSAGLLITMLATHLVGKFLVNHDHCDSSFSAHEMTCGSLVMVVLILYLYVLEKAGNH